jgi:hypothetical protein
VAGVALLVDFSLDPLLSPEPLFSPDALLSLDPELDAASLEPLDELFDFLLSSRLSVR